ncbi:MAG: hypothetical protein FWD13_00725 [Treponema sp.]|nr:hypothetical protein [Treponema sp.]
MKKGFLFFALIVLLVSGVYAQDVLRDGIYMMQGSQDTIHIFNIPQYRGNITMTAFAEGNFREVMFHQAGFTVGNQINNVIFWISPQLSGMLPVGTRIIYTIRNNSTFVDGAGQVWTWRREMPR